jgi:hypothetical protein
MALADPRDGLLEFSPEKDIVDFAPGGIRWHARDKIIDAAQG